MNIQPDQSLQDQFASRLICFGCGPANPLGLQLKSYLGSAAQEDAHKGFLPGLEPPGNWLPAGLAAPPPLPSRLVASFQPQAHHQAFPGVVNGGIISTLLDCHLNWTAVWRLMIQNQLTGPPCCVTANYQVTFKAPTPAGVLLMLQAWPLEVSERKGKIFGVLGPVDDRGILQQVTATGEGTFVAVKPGHPAFHRW
jgi:acyl-coenzyme A thioesterase PaaI-like protein